MAAGDSGSTGHTLIKGLRRWVRPYRKGKGIKGPWKHKGNEVGLRLLPFPPGNLISIHLMLASRFVYHAEWVRSHSASNSPTMTYHKTL